MQPTVLGNVREAVNTCVTKWSVEVTPAQLKAGVDLLTEFSDVWHTPKVGKRTTVTMNIKVVGRPKRVKARPVPVHLRAELNKQIDDLLAANVIIPAPDCEWVAACHLVPKPRSILWRLVIDYRYINLLI